MTTFRLAATNGAVTWYWSGLSWTQNESFAKAYDSEIKARNGLKYVAKRYPVMASIVNVESVTPLVILTGQAAIDALRA